MHPLLATALRAAEAAAAVHRTHFRRLTVESAREKGRSDFVSAVDLEAQEAAMAVIRDAFPKHQILAEEEVPEQPARQPAGAESGSRRDWPENARCLWIIDPLDGTTNYLHGHPMFAASVAVGRANVTPHTDSEVPGPRPTERLSGWERGPNAGIRFRGVLEAAAVVAPRTQERWWASRGTGAWKNGRRISVSRVSTLNRALVGTGFPFKEPDLVGRHAAQLLRVLPASGGVRRTGAAALDLCYLAEGVLDAFWEEDYLSPWDIGAGLLILSEAGGVASRLDGAPLDLENGSVLAANSRKLHDRLGELVGSDRVDSRDAKTPPDPLRNPRSRDV
jgi:myo-inositol-1(or 4)-monophosphatase